MDKEISLSETLIFIFNCLDEDCLLDDHAGAILGDRTNHLFTETDENNRLSP